MERTQIYLSRDETELVDAAARSTGASRSEVIRRAIRAALGSTSVDERMAALRRTAGLWRDREVTGADYVDRRRGDLNARLRRLGIE